MKTNGSSYPSPNAASNSGVVSNDLIKHQEAEKASIFPGPMWLPLHILLTHALDSLTHLQVKVPPFDMDIDLRNYLTLFQQTAAFTVKVRETLESIVIVFGESERTYKGPGNERCRTGRMYRTHCYRPWCIKMAKLFLEQMLAALNGNALSRLEEIRFEGVYIPKDANPHEAANAELEVIFQSIEHCRFISATFTEISSIDGRSSFPGHSSRVSDNGRFSELLADS